MRSFTARNKKIENFPSNLYENFPNLTSIVFEKSNLKEITRENLYNFTNLIYLNLEGNEIKILWKDLFVKNLKLETILMKNNQIVFIYEDLFENLTNLNRLDFSYNLCTSIHADSKDEIKNTTEIIQKNCTLVPKSHIELMENLIKTKTHDKTMEKIKDIFLAAQSTGIILLFLFYAGTIIKSKFWNKIMEDVENDENDDATSRTIFENPETFEFFLPLNDDISDGYQKRVSIFGNLVPVAEEQKRENFIEMKEFKTVIEKFEDSLKEIEEEKIYEKEMSEILEGSLTENAEKQKNVDEGIENVEKQYEDIRKNEENN
ncbi:hypothetical protein PVAND_016934 [Polypedilum vanderplanki]|uniref:Uncharacterized protein n=1 Tax=Polypedilum vanderplanki TaxID=319348 RepID=A0A9J6BH88_POLVA|nr:hypothetical protein PVAND_016934 [Polypedilum vanderplanki]